MWRKSDYGMISINQDNPTFVLREYWESLKPAGGRPFCPPLSQPDAWGVTQGHDILKQQTEETKAADIERLQKLKKTVGSSTWKKI